MDKEDNITQTLAENIIDTLKRKKLLDFETYQLILNKVKAAHPDVKDAHPDEGDDGSPSSSGNWHEGDDRSPSSSGNKEEPQNNNGNEEEPQNNNANEEEPQDNGNKEEERPELEDPAFVIVWRQWKS